MLSRRDLLVKAAGTAGGLAGLSLFQLTNLIGLPSARAEPTIEDPLRLLATGTGLSGLGVWAGQGCSGLGSAVRSLGIPDTAIDGVDFAADAALVVRGLAAGSARLDAAGRSIEVEEGTDWAIFAVGRAALAPRFNVRLGETIIPAAFEG